MKEGRGGRERKIERYRRTETERQEPVENQRDKGKGDRDTPAGSWSRRDETGRGCIQSFTQQALTKAHPLPFDVIDDGDKMVDREAHPQGHIA